MLHEFFLFVFTGTALTAICVPSIVSLFFAVRYRRNFSLQLLAAFVVGTAESVYLSTWWETPDSLSLHVFPATILMLLAMPAEYRPSWRVGYSLSFASLLLTDVICTARYSVGAGCLEARFFCGIGGAGVHDALVVVPLLSAVALASINWCSAKGYQKIRIGWPSFKATIRV